jgi:hypothetical protein
LGGEWANPNIYGPELLILIAVSPARLRHRRIHREKIGAALDRCASVLCRYSIGVRPLTPTSALLARYTAWLSYNQPNSLRLHGKSTLDFWTKAMYIKNDIFMDNEVTE